MSIRHDTPGASQAPALNKDNSSVSPLTGSTGPLLPISDGQIKRQVRESYWTLLRAPALIVASVMLMGLTFGPAEMRLSLWDGWSNNGGDPRVDVPALKTGLVDDCKALLNPPEDLYTARLGRLATLLHENNAVWIAEPGPSVEYFIGGFGSGVWKPSERPLLVAIAASLQGEHSTPTANVTILTPAFEERRARQQHLDIRVADNVVWVSWSESAWPYTVLAQHLGTERGALVIDGAMRSFVSSGLRRAWNSESGKGDNDDVLGATAQAVAALRERKDEREVGLMRCANVFTLHAIRNTRARMRIGISESETRAILYEEMSSVGLTDYSALVLFGENAALPHGSGSNRKLGRHDLALIDAGGRWGGYIADITRTFNITGQHIPQVHQTVWEIVRLAQLAPANLLALVEERDEPVFSWLDDTARERVKRGMAWLGVPPARGHGPDYTVFTHRLGHGIGLEGHEPPYAVQGRTGERRILPGHSLTFEPGVYIPADSHLGNDTLRGLGVRIEDVVVVREDHDGSMRAEWLTGPVQKFGDV